MKRKLTFHPKEYAIGQTEKFYTDMAAKGWHLEKRGAWLSKFVQGQPMDMKYRVEVFSEKDGISGEGLPEEQLAVYEDCGWEYVSKSGFINVFRAPADSDTEEFYLDPAQQADTLKLLRKNMFWHAIHIPVVLFVMILMNIMMGQNMPAQIYLAWISETVGVLGYIAIILAFGLDGILGAFHLNKLYHQMKKGIPLDHSPEKQGRLSTVIKYSILAIGVVAVVSVYLNRAYPMPAESDGAYVTLREIGIDAPRGNNYLGHESSVSHSTTPYAQYWDTYEVLEQDTVWMYQDVFMLKDKEKATKTAKALMNTSTFAQYEGNFNELEFAGLDKVYYNADLELVVINNNYVGYFSSIFTEESRTELLTHLAEKWK